MRNFRFKQMRGAICSVLFGAMDIACMALARTFDDSIGGPCKKVRQSLAQSTKKSRSGQLS